MYLEKQRQDAMLKLKLQRHLIKKKNRYNFLLRMKEFSLLPQFKDAMFNIPKELQLLDQYVLTIEEIDHFIWSKNLIILKDRVQEEVVNEDEEESTQSAEHISP